MFAQRSNTMNKRSWILVVVLAAALVLSALTFAQEDAPFLGVGVDSSDNGARIIAVVPESPAAQAGLEEGDIITAVNGTEVTADTLAETVQSLSVGDSVTLTVLRDGDTLELQAELTARPDDIVEPERQRFPGGDRPYLGVRVDDDENGVIVREVEPESPAAAGGVQAGDVLVSINGEALESGSAAIALIRTLEAGDTVTLEVQRGDESLSLDVTLGSMTENDRFFIPEGAQALDIVIYNPRDEVWEVLALAEDNALAEAGVQQSDQITRIDGTAYNPESLAEYRETLADDTQVILTVERNGETQEISVPATALDALITFDFRFFGEGRPGRGREGGRGGMPFNPEGFGMMIGGAQLGVAFEMVAEGARITDVVPESPAAEAGVQVDDVVTAVNGEVLDEERTLRDRLFAYEPGDTVTLDVQRGSETLSLDVTLTAFSLGEMMPFFGGERGFFDMLPRMFGPDGDVPFEFEAPEQSEVTPEPSV
jgi:S1-C subfamily serine protease